MYKRLPIGRKTSRPRGKVCPPQDLVPFDVGCPVLNNSGCFVYPSCLSTRTGMPMDKAIKLALTHDLSIQLSNYSFNEVSQLLLRLQFMKRELCWHDLSVHGFFVWCCNQKLNFFEIFWPNTFNHRNHQSMTRQETLILNACSNHQPTTNCNSNSYTFNKAQGHEVPKHDGALSQRARRSLAQTGALWRVGNTCAVHTAHGRSGASTTKYKQNQAQRYEAHLE